MSPGMDKKSGDSQQSSNVFQAFWSEIEPNQNQLWSNLSELAIFILPTSLAVNNQAWNGKGLSPMELLPFLFMAQIEFSCLQCPSQMPHVYEGAPYAALPKEEKSNPAFKHNIYVTTMRVTRIGTAYFPFDQGLMQWYMHLIFKSKTVCAGYLHHSTYFSLSAGSAWRFWYKNSSSYISEHWGVGHLIKRLSRSPHHQLINYTADTLPESSLFNHPSAITFPDRVDHFMSINWIRTRHSGQAICS